jgi:hypothetical protein
VAFLSSFFVPIFESLASFTGFYVGSARQKAFLSLPTCQSFYLPFLLRFSTSFGLPYILVFPRMTAHQTPNDGQNQLKSYEPNNGQIVTGDKIAPVELDSNSDTSNHPRQLSEEQHPVESNGDGAVEKVATGASLGRVPSQAQKLGKKKIIVVMTALCVRRTPSTNHPKLYF